MRWAGFGSVLAEDVDQVYLLSSISYHVLHQCFLVFLNLTITNHRLDNSRLKSYIPFMFIVTFA